jgi:hypothetical protein
MSLHYEYNPSERQASMFWSVLQAGIYTYFKEVLMRVGINQKTGFYAPL